MPSKEADVLVGRRYLIKGYLDQALELFTRNADIRRAARLDGLARQAARAWAHPRHGARLRARPRADSERAAPRARRQGADDEGHRPRDRPLRARRRGSRALGEGRRRPHRDARAQAAGGRPSPIAISSIPPRHRRAASRPDADQSRSSERAAVWRRALTRGEPRPAGRRADARLRARRAAARRPVVKLNTNENPYPPSPRRARARCSRGASADLRLYPDPMRDGAARGAPRGLRRRRRPGARRATAPTSC